MEVVDDVCESEGVCEVMCDVLSDQPERGESMETHVSGDDKAARMAESASAEEHADLSAAAPSAGNTGTEPPKPRYSYRLVFKEVCCKPLDVFRLFLALYCCTQRGYFGHLLDVFRANFQPHFHFFNGKTCAIKQSNLA